MTLAPDSDHLMNLSERFPDAEFFQEGELVGFIVRTPHMEAKFFLHGGTLAELRDEKGLLLWLSPESKYQKDKAIRGGIPICWPWFGQLQQNPISIQKQVSSIKHSQASQHGFARVCDWNLEAIYHDQEYCEVVMTLNSNQETLKIWPFEFELTARYKLTEELTVELTTQNQSKQSFEITQALHTYLPTEDIAQTQVIGFEETRFIDALDDWQNKVQEDGIRFTENVDRIYMANGPARIISPSGELLLFAQQSDSTVVWNPWSEKSKEMSDFPDDGYLRMLCVETSNVMEDKKLVLPNQSVNIGFRLARRDFKDH